MFKKSVVCVLIGFGAFIFLGVYSFVMAAQESDFENLPIDSLQGDVETASPPNEIESVPPAIGEHEPFDPRKGLDGQELKANYKSLEEETPEERYQREGKLVDNVYMPLFERLALQEDKQNEFRDLLIKVRISWNDMEADVRKDGTSDEKIKYGLKKMGDAAWELDQQVEELLGSSDYIRYDEYKSSLGVFMTDAVDEFEKLLSDGEQISKKQESQLVTAMAEEYESFILSFVGKMNGPPSYRVEMREKKVLKNIEGNIEHLKNRYYERAKSIINETQLVIYKAVIEQKIDTRKNFAAEKVEEIEKLSKTKEPVLYRDIRDE